MQTIHVHRSQMTTTDDPSTATLIIDLPIPPGTEAHTSTYLRDAELIATLFKAVLPHGTLEALKLKLCGRAVHIF